MQTLVQARGKLSLRTLRRGHKHRKDMTMRTLGNLLRKIDNCTDVQKLAMGIVTICVLGYILTIHYSNEHVSAPPTVTEPAVAHPVTVLTPEEKRQVRKDYAAKVDQRFIDAGIESTTNTGGTADTTLIIHDALAGRVRANIIGKSLNFPLLKEMGFKKVDYRNDFDGELFFGINWDVNKN
jgi:hypothetical protein